MNRNSTEAVKKQTTLDYLNWVMNILCKLDRYSHSNKGNREPGKQLSQEQYTHYPKLHPQFTTQFRIINLPDKTTFCENF